MIRKKKCKCGFVAAALSLSAVNDALIEHCNYTGTCVAREAKDV